MQKKFLALLLTLTMALALAACGSSAATAPQAETAAVSQPEEHAASEAEALEEASSQPEETEEPASAAPDRFGEEFLETLEQKNSWYDFSDNITYETAEDGSIQVIYKGAPYVTISYELDPDDPLGEKVTQIVVTSPRKLAYSEEDDPYGIDYDFYWSETGYVLDAILIQHDDTEFPSYHESKGKDWFLDAVDAYYEAESDDAAPAVLGDLALRYTFDDENLILIVTPAE